MERTLLGERVEPFRMACRIMEPSPMRFSSYDSEQFYDEMFERDGKVRPEAEPLLRMIDGLNDGDLPPRQQAAERPPPYSGITFNVYGDKSGAEKIFPFDILPRIVCSKEFERIEA